MHEEIPIRRNGGAGSPGVDHSASKTAKAGGTPEEAPFPDPVPRIALRAAGEGSRQVSEPNPAQSGDAEARAQSFPRRERDAPQVTGPESGDGGGPLGDVPTEVWIGLAALLVLGLILNS